MDNYIKVIVKYPSQILIGDYIQFESNIICKVIIIEKGIRHSRENGYPYHFTGENNDIIYNKTFYNNIYKFMLNYTLVDLKQNYNDIELKLKLKLIYEDKINLVHISNDIILNIYEDKIYDKIIDILEHINTNYIYNQYGNNTEYIVIYNNIIVSISNDTDNEYSYLEFTYNKNISWCKMDLTLLLDVFKFLLK